MFVFRFKNPATGKILIPFTRVLSVTEDDRMAHGANSWTSSAGVRVERLVWVEGDSPAFSQFHISIEHGLHLLDEPIENLHGVSFHRIRQESSISRRCAPATGLQCRKLL